MAYEWSGNVRTRQHRAATAPTPSQPPFSPAIPPSLIPGRRTLSATGTVTNGLLYSGPDIGSHPSMVSATFNPVTDGTQFYSMNPSRYRDIQPPPPPLPLPQSLLPQSIVQSIVPPLPPKTPFKVSPTPSPTLPPKPPPPIVPPPPTVLRPTVPRSQSQPPMPYVASPPQYVPPLLPPKPLGARSPSLPHPNVSPRAKPSVIARSPDTNDTAQLTLPSANSSAEGSLGMKEEEEFELALEISLLTEREHANSLLSGDADLARALEQSLLEPAPRPVHPRSRPNTLIVDSEPVPSSSTKPWDARPRNQRPVSHALSVSPVDAQLKEDEALARRLEAEYDGETTPTPGVSHNVDPNPSESAPLPRYADVVSKEAAAVKYSEPNATASPHILQASLTSGHSHERPFILDQANSRRNTPSPAQRTSPRPESQATTASPTEEEAPEISPTYSPPSRTIVTPNQFIEPELLYGVSFGFNPPLMENVGMRDSFPDKVVLPYGKSAPLHIRASSWRQLLKLMAKLSTMRIEPTVEAVAATKGDLYLRTVVQFFKVHQTSSDWRTVIYLTIDYPPPPDHRATNGDVNVLPYSYSLSTLPALLRSGRESQLSKYYTVPATSRTPLPKLPLSMPDMAMYLASALEDSRQAAGDSSSGHRKLAKMIDAFYPTRQSRGADGEEEEPRRGGRAFIGRLMGRTSRPQGGRNAEVYELVTPFVSREWG